MMKIQSAKWTSVEHQSIFVELETGEVLGVADDMQNRHRVMLQDWIDADPINNIIADPDPPPAPPTTDELVDDLLNATDVNRRIIKALALVVADKTGMTPAEIRAAIIAKM